MEDQFQQEEEMMDREDLEEELAIECEQCKEIQEEMNMFFEADGLTYTHPEKES